jgi:deoxyribonuclease-4
MRVGMHVGIERGFEHAVAYAERLGCDSLQLFSSTSKTYRIVAPNAPVLSAFRDARSAAGITTSAIHTSYLINLASEDPAIASKSLGLLANDLAVASAAGVDFVNTHLGSYGNRPREAGFASVTELLGRALENIKPGVYLILENSAGAGKLCGGTLEELGAFVRAVDHPQLGVCLDTAHSWAAGYAIDSRDGVERFLEQADAEISLERIKMFHFNDTQIPLGGHRDRHWHIGEGLIGFEGFRALLSHPQLADKTAILETPGDEADDVRNVQSIRAILAGVAR